MTASVDDGDVQGLVRGGYGQLRAASYVLLEIENPPDACAWLERLAEGVTSARGGLPDRAVNVALTLSGMRRLGLPPRALQGFSLEFQEGMTSPHRSRLLGDEGDAAPTAWAWGGPANQVVDVLLLLFAADDAELADLLRTYSSEVETHGLRHVTTLGTYDSGATEHFGFHDGISQPSIPGLTPPAPPRDTVQAGEFLLGYLNEHDQYTDRPLVEPAADPHALLPDDPAGSSARDLGRNGTYLIFRQLSQDVGTFWRFAQEATRHPDGSADPRRRDRLAARMVGRWPSGAPLTVSPDQDRADLAGDNDFGYAEYDPHGLRCPVGAHVRRTNPRDALPPKTGDPSVAVTKRHRILRRGRRYGTPVGREEVLAGTAPVGGERGLHFVCLCANIARQFEFVQKTWALDPHFAGLYDDADPLLSGHLPAGRTFTTQAVPVRHRTPDVPAFVTVRGGSYFFLPGLRALRYLASLGRAAPDEEIARQRSTR